MPIDLAPGLVVQVVPPVMPTVRAAPPSSSTVVVPVSGPSGPTGPQGPAGPAGSVENSGYLHQQITTDDTWTIVHNLGFYPAGVTAKDSVGDIVEPRDIIYVNENTVQLLFTGRHISGTARLS